MIASHDLLRAVIGAQRHRRALVRPHDGAGLGDHLQRAERAVVLRRVRIDQIGQRHHDRGAHVREGRVDESDHLLMRIRQIDGQVAASLGHCRADVDVGVAMAVVIEERLAVVHAVLPGRDHRARLAFGAVEHRLDRRVRGVPAELAGERQHAPLADMRRADHRREVAAEVVRMAHVGHQHFQHVAPHRAAVVEAQRRDADALLPDLGGAGVVGTVGGAADVALVRAVDRPEHRSVVLEDRHERGQVGKVVAAVIGIVQQEHVARMDVARRRTR